MLTLVIAIATAHVPFFEKDISHIKKNRDISQAYYWKNDGYLYASETDQMPQNTLIEIVTSAASDKCSVVINCDAQNTNVNFSRPPQKTVEPFTQSSYHKVYSSDLTCTDTFSVNGTCGIPWASVVGKKEQFTAKELFMFPVYTSKIHGSWWNKSYLTGWLILAIGFLLTLYLIYSARQKSYKARYIFTLYALTVFISYFIAKVISAARFAPSVASFAVASVEVLPITAAIWLINPFVMRTTDFNRGMVVFCFSFALYFFLGAGYIIGNILMAIGGLLYTIPDQTQSAAFLSTPFVYKGVTDGVF